MAELSVLTVSKRAGWEEQAYACLNNQTYKDYEWIVVSELPLVVDHLKAPNKIRTSNLNASLNHGLRHCNGRYVVFYQDFIIIAPGTLKRLVAAADKTGGFVTTATHEAGVFDGRYTGVDCLRPCLPEEWEANVAIAPMDAIRALGGFDEEYDDGWSWDNVNLAERAAMLGYTFWIDEAIQPQLLPHPKEPELHPDWTPNGEFHAERMRAIKDGRHPLRCDYL